MFPEGSGAGISTPSASADPLLAGAGTAASAVVGCSRERARAASSALADIAAGSRCYPRDVFAAARPLLLARKDADGEVSRAALLCRESAVVLALLVSLLLSEERPPPTDTCERSAM